MPFPQLIFLLGHHKSCPPRGFSFLGTINHVPKGDFTSWAPQIMSPKGIFLLGHHKSCLPRGFSFLGTINHVPQGDFPSWAPKIMSPKGIFILGHYKSCPQRVFSFLGTINHVSQGDFISWAPRNMSPKGISILGTKNHLLQGNFPLGHHKTRSSMGFLSPTELKSPFLNLNVPSLIFFNLLEPFWHLSITF